MRDNTDDEHLDKPTNTPPENSSDEIILTTTTAPINQIQETENMEVHKHPHHVTHKKKWTGYVLEFLMLFLAVFLGFIAENQREHFVEHQREKKFAKRLLSDLRADSLFFETRIQLLEKRQQTHEEFLKIMANPAGATDPAVHRGFVRILLLTPTSNDFTTATYNQMKTSGSLRYIYNDNLTTSLQQYYDVLLAKISRDSEGADKFFADYIIAYMTKHFRFQDFKSGDGSSLPVKLLNRSAESDQELINIMGVWSANCNAQLDLQRPAQELMLALIKVIKNEYHLE
jgi:hypothetical protein